MGGKAKVALLIAALSLIPSFIEFQKGYLVLTSLLTHVLLALAFGLFASTLLSAVFAIFKIQNFETERHAALEEARSRVVEANLITGPAPQSSTLPLPQQVPSEPLAEE